MAGPMIAKMDAAVVDSMRPHFVRCQAQEAPCSTKGLPGDLSHACIRPCGVPEVSVKGRPLAQCDVTMEPGLSSRADAGLAPD